MNSSSINAENDKKNNAIAVAKGSVVSLAISFAAFLLLALILLFGTVSDSLVGPITVVISLCAIFAGAYIASKSIGKNGWLWGGICGFVYYIIVYISALGAIKEFNFSARTFVMMIIGIVCGMIGGIFGINTKSKKRRR